MVIKKIKDNKELSYEVIFDSQKVKELIDKIVKDCSYKEEGDFNISNLRGIDFNNFQVTGALLSNGEPVYQDIKNIYRFTSSSSYSYYHDSIGLIGSKVHEPKLATILCDIVNVKVEDLSELELYPGSAEIIPIDSKIDALDKEIDKISNYNYPLKIQKLRELSTLLNDKKIGSFFDTELLSKYYIEAINLFELRLICRKELIKDGEKIPLLPSEMSRRFILRPSNKQ